MNDQLFLDVLFETKVNAIRHHSKEEAVEAIRKIKLAIKQHRFEIVDRDKNLDFMHDEHLNKETACMIIDKFLEPKNLIAILPNRNKEGGELYLFSLCIPVKDRVKYVYLKVEITSYGKVIAISFHKQNEKMHADYRQATDNPDNVILKKMAQVWTRTYNKFGRVGLDDATVDGDDIIFTFERSVNDDDDDVLQDLARSVPKDFGYRYKDVVNNVSYHDGKIIINFPFGKF